MSAADPLAAETSRDIDPLKRMTVLQVRDAPARAPISMNMTKAAIMIRDFFFLKIPFSSKSNSPLALASELILEYQTLSLAYSYFNYPLFE